jgi:predicted ester cyclase
MSTEENKAIVRRVYEAINSKDPDALDAVIATDANSNTRFPHGKSGLEGFKQSFAAAVSSFPDYTITIDDQIAEGDKVVTRYTARGTQEGDFMGVAPTGEAIELIGIDIDRLAGGRIVEHWSEANLDDLMVKLGVALPR